jgi:UDP-GlcNAc:undecaprenyl-phosphate GlcNAc-1-phosphate transferase
MYSLLFLGFTSFVLSLLLTPVVRHFSHRWGLVDQPDHGRKLHTSPIPRLGGVAILAAYLLAFAALLLSPLQAVHLIKDGLPLAFRLAPAVAIIFFTGIFDDIHSLRPWHKFGGQIAAGIVTYAVGVQVEGFGGYTLPHWLSLPATVFWLVLCTNAINLIDGVDGLATGVGLFATATTLLAALLQNNIDLALAVAPLLGCLLGFLRYNFNPATIFLGDSGSLFVGFLLGCCSIIWSQKSATILGMTAPLLALAIPLLDTSLALVRRFLRQQPLFTADRGHIHHRLLDRGLTPRKVALLIYGLCTISAMLSLTIMSPNFQGFAVILFCAGAWIGIQHLGYVEFGVAGRMFIEGAFRRHLNTNIALQMFEARLVSATTADECWKVVQDSGKEFGFHTIDMTLAGRRYEYCNGGLPQPSWTVRIPLSERDFVELTREFDSNAHSAVAPFADSIRKTIGPKVPGFERSAGRAAGAP